MFTIDTSLAVQENPSAKNERGELYAYPNPTQSLIKLSFPQCETPVISIYKTNGERVFHKIYSPSNTAIIDTKSFSTGFYFVAHRHNKKAIEIRKKLFVFVGSVSLPFYCVEAQQNKTPPNFIFYLADDQDQLDYGVYGNPKVHTPAVDALAKEGMRFTNFYTSQAICAPSRSQIFTGMYPWLGRMHGTALSLRLSTPGVMF